MANTREHRYAVSLTWNGNLGSGTSGYRDYSRDYEIGSDGKPAISGSADPAFQGDRTRWNPEELLVASLSACHKLWYLHLAAEAGIIVTAYGDRAEGVMEVGQNGTGRFKSVVLRPTVTLATGNDVELARTLHKPAHEKCFIANSVNFPVECEPEIVSAREMAGQCARIACPHDFCVEPLDRGAAIIRIRHRAPGLQMNNPEPCHAEGRAD